MKAVPVIDNVGSEKGAAKLVVWIVLCGQLDAVVPSNAHLVDDVVVNEVDRIMFAVHKTQASQRLVAMGMPTGGIELFDIKIAQMTVR